MPNNTERTPNTTLRDTILAALAASLALVSIALLALAADSIARQ